MNAQNEAPKLTPAHQLAIRKEVHARGAAAVRVCPAEQRDC